MEGVPLRITLLQFTNYHYHIFLFAFGYPLPYPDHPPTAQAPDHDDDLCHWTLTHLTNQVISEM